MTTATGPVQKRKEIQGCSLAGKKMKKGGEGIKHTS